MLKTLRTATAALLAAATLGLANVQPARADGAATTRTIVLGAAALAAGLAIASNVAHKNAQAETIAGYLPDGAPVYADGHVALPNGQSYYPGNYGQTIACNDGACSLRGGNGSPYNGYGYGSGNGYGDTSRSSSLAHGRRDRNRSGYARDDR